MPRQFRPFLAAVAVLVAAHAGATVLVPADLTELSRGASAIVRGTVVAVKPGWADGRHRVETVVTVSVVQSLKGAYAGNISFKVPGGDMGRYRSMMIGAPTFHEGEEVILFLGGTAPALPHLLGLGQGVYHVERDTRTGERRVISPTLVADPDQTVKVRRGDPSRRSLSVDEFAAQVRDALEAGNGRSRRGAPTGRTSK
jgi:hypothetical protein